MSFYLIKTPKLIQNLFNEYIWSFSFKKTPKKVIHLTFDDGPTPEITDWTLDLLKKHNAKATFFCIGKNIDAHPKLFNRIVSEGHAIGNHTYNHLNGWKTNNTDYIKNIEKTEKSIQQYLKNTKLKTQNSKLLFRPPYGKIKNKQAKLLLKKGYSIIMWNVLSGDFDQTISPKKCTKNVLKNTQNGSIIVFHDSVKASKNIKYALPKVLGYFDKKGYSFKHIALPK